MPALPLKGKTAEGHSEFRASSRATFPTFHIASLPPHPHYAQTKIIREVMPAQGWGESGAEGHCRAAQPPQCRQDCGPEDGAPC